MRWRQANFGTTVNTGDAADGADPDGDGATNAQEFAAGTNPRDAASVFKVTRLQADQNGWRVSFLSVSGKTYRLETSTTLQADSWTTVQDNIAGTGGEVQVLDSASGPAAKRFYRFALLP